jgi:UDP-N-acetylmuramoyl-tripeptide--D-alanyl-D-alanine ligase
MTALWTADALVEATGGRVTWPFAATGVAIDSRSLKPGDLFVALQGEHRDGHGFIADAVARGAAGVLVHRSWSGPALLVDDTLAALTRMGAYARARFAGRVVAVTGSVGKTTTKEMLRTILGAVGQTHAAEASHNNHWGVPLTLARLPQLADFAVIEIGMNHAGEIAPLARLAGPHVALITTIECAHIGHLGSIKAIADEKAGIMQGLTADGIAVLPADNPLSARLLAAAGPVRVVTFGRGGEVRLTALRCHAAGSEATAVVGRRKFKFRLGVAGEHMAMSAMAAMAAASALGIDLEHATAALAQFAPIAGRGLRRPIHLPSGEALLLDESYNASTASVRAALAVLKLQPARRRLAVLGDMLELGDEAVGEHVSLSSDVASAADLLFACGPFMRHLFDAAPPSLRAIHTIDAAALAPVVAAAVRPGDAVLVKGSLGSRMKRVVEALDAIGAR